MLVYLFNLTTMSTCVMKRDLKSRSFGIQVQVIGILVSIIGAMLAEFFKGPFIRPSSHQLRHTKQLFVFSSIPEFWVLSGILIAAASFSFALWNFIQMLWLR